MNGALLDAIYFQLNNPDTSARSIANHYSVSVNTLIRKINAIKPLLPAEYSKRIINSLVQETSNSGGSPSRLNEFQEQNLIEIISHKATEGQGLNPEEVCALAAEMINAYSSNNNIIKPLSLSWYYSFMKRNPTLSLRNSMPLTSARAAALSEETVDDLFNKLTSVYKDQNIATPDRIFNLDEKGFDGESMRRRGVVAPKKQKRVNNVFSGWREHWSALAIVNAAGFACPPLFVFTGKEVPEGILNHGPIGAKATVQENGYFTQSIFKQVIDHLLEYTSSIQKPILLIFDGSDSHLDLSTLQYAVDNSIIPLQLPPQTTHRLQPLDVSVFKPFSDYWKQSVKRFKKDNYIKSINKYNVAECIVPAWQHATVPSTVISGFRNCGYWPLDRSKITLEDCSPAKMFHSDNNGTQLDSNMNIDFQGSKLSTEFQDNTNRINNMNIDELRHYALQTTKENIELKLSKKKKKNTVQQECYIIHPRISSYCIQK
jgi:hypothetical protein